MPYNFRSLFLSISDILDINRGFFFTLYTLLVSPKRILTEYFSGKTIPYNNPLRFLFTIIACISIVAILGSQEEIDFLDVLPVLLFFLIYTVVFNLIVYRSRFAAIENFISALYLTAILIFLASMITIIFFALETFEFLPYNDTLAASVSLVLMAGYIINYYAQVSTTRNWVAYLKPFLYFVGIVIFFFIVKVSIDVVGALM